MVVQQPSKLPKMGSIPTSRSNISADVVKARISKNYTRQDTYATALKKCTHHRIHNRVR